MCVQKLKLKINSERGKKHKQVAILYKAKYSQGNKHSIKHIPKTSNRKYLGL